MLFRNWKAAVQSTSPLLLLGFARLLTTRSVDYQVDYLSNNKLCSLFHMI